MKNIGLIFIFYTLFSSNNNVISQPIAPSNNITWSKEYINVHNPPHPPGPISYNMPHTDNHNTLSHISPVSTALITTVATEDDTTYGPVPPSTPLRIPTPNRIPTPHINSIYLTPTCQNMI